MRARTIGLAVVAVMAVTLLGCGQAGLIASHGGITPAATTPSQRVATSPPASTPVAQATPTAPPSTPSPPRPMVERPPAMTFAIMPLFPAGASGTIAVVVTGGVAHYHGEVAGLVPGSAHTIHDHAGTCQGGLSSRHVAVLVTAAADPRGVIVFDVTVPAADFGAGRIVLVYQSARASVIAGCATL